MINQNSGNFLYHIEEPEDKLFLSFENGKFTCYNSLFKKVMENQGIQIPPSFASTFNGSRKIYPTEEALFEKAFREIYFPLHMPKNEYYWSNN